MKKNSILFTCLTALSLAISSAALAANSETTSNGGIIGCGGDNFLRLSGSEAAIAAYNFRNVNSTNSITINNLRVYNSRGTVIYDSAISGLPQTQNQIFGPGGGNNIVGPKQTAQLLSNDFLPFLDILDRPIQLEITWSAQSKVIPLSVSLVRINRARNASTGALLEERARHSFDCSTRQNDSTVEVRSYIPASTAGYTSFVRVINTSSVAAQVMGQWVYEDGTTSTAASMINSHPAAGSVTLTSTQIEAALGAPIVIGNNRPRLRLTAPTTGLEAMSFTLSNANGNFSDTTGGQ